ncbi:hypothetical protein HY224_03130 [Candidatus Uhrbacteria bacterium]|nr:hypothetical protein [Candidatus Uhrbacteria bacterium]
MKEATAKEFIVQFVGVHKVPTCPADVGAWAHFIRDGSAKAADQEAAKRAERTASGAGQLQGQFRFRMKRELARKIGPGLLQDVGFQLFLRQIASRAFAEGAQKGYLQGKIDALNQAPTFPPSSLT